MINTAQLTNLINRLVCSRCQKICLVCGEPFPVKATKPRTTTPEAEVLNRILHDPSLPTLRAKARALGPILNISVEAAMSRLRRGRSEG